MIKFLLELFVLYIIYKFIFELVLPVYYTTKDVKRKMQSFQEQMNRQEASQFQQKEEKRTENTGTKSNFKDDYIEFEEIK